MKPKKTARWFALDKNEPLAFFRWHLDAVTGERGSIKNPQAERMALLPAEQAALIGAAPLYPLTGTSRSCFDVYFFASIECKMNTQKIGLGRYCKIRL